MRVDKRDQKENIVSQKKKQTIRYNINLQFLCVIFHLN
jgi:hypothetical protein